MHVSCDADVIRTAEELMRLENESVEHRSSKKRGKTKQSKTNTEQQATQVLEQLPTVHSTDLSAQPVNIATSATAAAAAASTCA